jgi:hypothetical protein
VEHVDQARVGRPLDGQPALPGDPLVKVNVLLAPAGYGPVEPADGVEVRTKNADYAKAVDSPKAGPVVDDRRRVRAVVLDEVGIVLGERNGKPNLELK